MAITNVDQALAGMQFPRPYTKAVTPTMVVGRPQSLWALNGNPGAGSFSTSLAGATLNNTSNGSIPFVNPVSGNSHLARIAAAATVAGQLVLYDRIWHNGGFTITSNTAQTINSVAFPDRDEDGTANGKGIVLGLEVSAAAGAAAPTITVSYTNQAGTAGRTGTNLFPTANSPTAGAFFPIGLQAGDTGVRSVQTLTLSASWVSGTINLVAYREIARLDLAGAFVPNSLDLLTGGFPRIFDSSCLAGLFIPSATTASNVSGSVIWTQG